MNPKKAKDNFKRIKDQVLKDGRIDAEEVDILLSFLEPYTRTYSLRFSTLRKLLHEAKTEGCVKDQEKMISVLEETEEFLKTEYKVERFLGYFLAFLLLFAVFYTALH